jgi:hypothetical protein
MSMEMFYRPSKGRTPFETVKFGDLVLECKAFDVSDDSKIKAAKSAGWCRVDEIGKKRRGRPKKVTSDVVDKTATD